MADPQHVYVNLHPGDAAPWFHQRASNNARFSFDTAAGRYIVLCFFLTGGDAQSRRALEAVAQNGALFDDARISFFGVSIDPKDEARISTGQTGVRFFWDFDGAVSKLYGALPRDSAPGEANVPGRRFWMVLDPTLRIRAIFPFAPDGGEIDAMFAHLKALPPPALFAGVPLQAPVIYLRDVFEPELCRTLIDYYETHGGEESGFMREVDGRTVEIKDHAHKRRSDRMLEDVDLRDEVQKRIRWRIVPEIRKVHQFTVTRMERYLVSCYADEVGGHFRAHRDNTTKGTAHRRFAVSINLNDDFEGGELSFPEYGPRSFKMPAGTAVVFSCSLLHAASPVTKGRRYAFLPFLYDDAAAQIRAENNKYLGEAVPAYEIEREKP